MLQIVNISSRKLLKQAQFIENRNLEEERKKNCNYNPTEQKCKAFEGQNAP